MAYSTERYLHNDTVYSGKGTLKDMRKLAVQIMRKEGYSVVDIVDLDKPIHSKHTQSKYQPVGEVRTENGKYVYEDFTVKKPHVKISYMSIDGSLKGIYFEHKGYEVTEENNKFVHDGRMPEKKFIEYHKAIAPIRKNKYLKIKNLTDNRIVYEGEYKNGRWYKIKK